jgi:hypothetical protein
VPFGIADWDIKDSFLKCMSLSLKTKVFVTFLLVILMVNSFGMSALARLSGSTSLMFYDKSARRAQNHVLKTTEPLMLEFVL